MALKTRKFNGVDFWFKLWIDVITLWSLKHFVIYEYFYRFPCTFRFSMTLILWSGRFLPLCKGKKEEKQRTREGSINFEKPRSWLKHADEADYNRIWIHTWEYRFETWKLPQNFQLINFNLCKKNTEGMFFILLSLW